MKTFTITEAKKSLGALLKRVVNGEEIGIITGAEIIALRKVEVCVVDKCVSTAPTLREVSGAVGVRDPLFEFTAFEGSGLGDVAINHDKYLYDNQP